MTEWELIIWMVRHSVSLFLPWELLHTQWIILEWYRHVKEPSPPFPLKLGPIWFPRNWLGMMFLWIRPSFTCPWRGDTILRHLLLFLKWDEKPTESWFNLTFYLNFQEPHFLRAERCSLPSPSLPHQTANQVRQHSEVGSRAGRVNCCVWNALSMTAVDMCRPSEPTQAGEAHG